MMNGIKSFPPGVQNTGGYYTQWNPSAFPDSFANEEYFGCVAIDSNIRQPRKVYDQIVSDFHVQLIAGFMACDTTYGLCNAAGVQFYDISKGSPDSWLWNFGDGGTSSLPNPVHIYTLEGSYTVSLTVYENGSASTMVKTEYIHCLPCNETVTGTYGSSTASCIDATQTITVAGNSTEFTLQSGGNLQMVAGENVRLLPHAHIQSGAWLNARISTNGLYCPAGSDHPEIVQINLGPDMTFTGSGLSYSVFPNPTSGDATLRFLSDLTIDQLEISIYNFTGVQLFKKIVKTQEDIDLPVSTFRPGLYLLSVRNGNIFITKKIIRH